jgi:large subunit ribosomal protein L36e
MVRDLIGEVVGLSPYEKRLLDMLKTGGVSSEKRMYKFAKRRVSLDRIVALLFFCTFISISSG